MTETKGKFSNWWEKQTGAPPKTWHKILITVFLLVFLFVFYVTLDANKYKAFVHVVDGKSVIGVNPTSEALDFGDLAKGTSAVRRVDIKNGTAIPMWVSVIKTGDLGELVSVDKKSFVLKSGDEEKVEFSIYIPASASIDSIYKGRVYVFKVPTFGLIK
ncbi:MAG: hypothetical protein COU07_04165 [Candidatus Harrisonbacteria bacterium CG10_big_fil_rev_8_21_14_0_10_40_38]|uniref:Uncharacterized protein n=1 Tax=Candidatus Harrisonbacteria bacterium CG10_big_fil_rev_8_21_14_0_10_40_38 TaxID=1974583 RepID=A0A2H0UT80_9BACT|nr:MAG: hypothetical protein COU07_04165 [Candidatus Harrisonbacteria bacterium CG10_big_fil_rev_8_21_14_0_10_40_38]